MGFPLDSMEVREAEDRKEGVQGFGLSSWKDEVVLWFREGGEKDRF